MKLAPSQWTGSARQLIQELLLPHFPAKSQVEVWHTFLTKKLSDADPMYIVGSTHPEQRSRWGNEKSFLTKHDGRITFSDRSPAVAVQTYLLEMGDLTAEKSAALYLQLPYHSFDLDKFTKWCGITNNVASAAWFVAPLFPGSTADEKWESLSRESLKAMTFRNLHPLNSFLFPNLNKSGRVFADDPRFHALIAEAYAKHYGSAWTAYLEATGDQVSQFPAPEDFELDLSATGGAGSVKLDSKDLITKIEPANAFDLKLVTVTESQGSHSRSLDPNLLTRGFYDLKLEFKDKAGAIKTVGFYRLNLKDLYEKKFIGRDGKGLKLAIYQTATEGEAHAFAVGLKKNGPFTPLPA